MNRFSQRSSFGTAVFIALTATGCSDATSPTGPAAQATLNQGMARWQTLMLEDYDMQQQRTCECLPELTQPMYIRVFQNQILNMWETGSFTLVDQDLWRLFLPVDALFDEIQEAIDAKVELLEVEYHAEFGYPMGFFMDPEVNVGDDEIRYTTAVFVGTL